MIYQFKPPFEIYHDGKQIADADGHICSAENEDIAKALVDILNRKRIVPSLAINPDHPDDGFINDYD